MNSKLTKILFYLPTAVLGLVGMFLQSRLLEYGYDQKGLLMNARLEQVLLWGLAAVFAALVLFFLPRLGARGTYEMNFPRCMASGLAIMAAGVLTGFSALNAMVPGGGLLLPAGCAAGAVLLILVGMCRMQGRKPAFWLELAVCLLCCANLLHSYRGWNARPNVQLYAFQLLAQICVMLFATHRARCAGGLMDRRRLVATGFLGMFFSFIALAGAGNPALYLAGGLYCAGGMCELKHFSRRRKRPVFPREEGEEGLSESQPEEGADA
ncbi:MAG: hypothetical protein IJ960_00265 [Oscillospiraceae bacterium]|nr:hypothetical protein [Oscillospiraceae bacterium]